MAKWRNRSISRSWSIFRPICLWYVCRPFSMSFRSWEFIFEYVSGLGILFWNFYFLWSRVPRKVPGKFRRSGQIPRSDHLEQNPTFEGDFTKISSKKSTSDPKILKSLDGTINMFITKLETNFQPQGAQTAGSNLWRPRLDGFAPRRPKILSNTKEINGFPL